MRCSRVRCSSAACPAPALLLHCATQEELTALHRAAEDGCVEVVRFLFDYCPALAHLKDEVGLNEPVAQSRPQESGMTPLHLAARGGEVEVVRLLLDLCPDLADETGRVMFCALVSARVP